MFNNNDSLNSDHWVKVIRQYIYLFMVTRIYNSFKIDKSWYIELSNKSFTLGWYKKN
jgi:hypothetical protein